MGHISITVTKDNPADHYKWEGTALVVVLLVTMTFWEKKLIIFGRATTAFFLKVSCNFVSEYCQRVDNSDAMLLFCGQVMKCDGSFNERFLCGNFGNSQWQNWMRELTKMCRNTGLILYPKHFNPVEIWPGYVSIWLIHVTVWCTLEQHRRKMDHNLHISPRSYTEAQAACRVYFMFIPMSMDINAIFLSYTTK